MYGMQGIVYRVSCMCLCLCLCLFVFLLTNLRGYKESEKKRDILKLSLSFESHLNWLRFLLLGVFVLPRFSEGMVCLSLLFLFFFFVLEKGVKLCFLLDLCFWLGWDLSNGNISRTAS